jgi:hypothetical protein
VDARARVAALLSSLEHLGIDDLSRLALPPGDRGDRAEARKRALAATDEAGLRSMADDAARDAGELVIRAFATNQYQPTWAGPQWGRSLGSARDRTNLIAAVEDAALAAVAADVARADDVAALAEPFQTLASMRGTYPELSLPGALASQVPFGPLGIAVMLGVAFLIGGVGFALGSVDIGLVTVVVALALAVACGVRRARAV